ncbi:MAG TPA: hypothetical protein DCY79_09790 [Planctomycetaceae bacterium]|jgi:hypothetical protein|nr:hypothetical protein [Blastopirellula sp.]HAY80081.1 hypothetical protein [Planctomycetaceae bacterium]
MATTSQDAGSRDRRLLKLTDCQTPLSMRLAVFLSPIRTPESRLTENRFWRDKAHQKPLISPVAYCDICQERNHQRRAPHPQYRAMP